MEFSGFVEITAENQGSIDGEGGHKDYPNAIRVFDFNHSLSVPVGQGRSMTSAEVIHKPIRLVKEIDKTTPKLYQALANREKLSQVVFTWLRYTPDGLETPYYRVRLQDAMLVKIAPWSPDAGQSSLRFMETIELVYSQISWSWGESESVVFETSWRTDRTEQV